MTSRFRPSARWLIILNVGLAAALLPALFGASWWPVWAAYLGLAALSLMADGLLSPRGRDLRASFDMPDTMLVGEDHAAVLRMSMRYGTTSSTSIRLDLSPYLVAPETVEGCLALEESEVVIPVTPTRRGVVSVDSIWLRYRGPLGLCQRTVRLPLDASARVMPSVRAVRSMALRFSLPNERMAGVKIERFAGIGSEYHALREYVVGLDSRWIDWKASARHNQLLCREYRAERNHHVVLAIDTGRLMGEELGGVPRMDHAIHGALLLAFLCLRSGDRVSLYSFDERPGRLSPPCAGAGGFQTLLSLSAELAYTVSESNFTLGLTHLSAQLRRRSLVVVVTDFVDAVTAELMIENLLRIGGRHLVLFVALRNPLLDSYEDREPRTMSDIERAVVVSSLARDRSLVVRRLARAGVLCIDALPDELGPALVNRYLEVKRREMI